MCSYGPSFGLEVIKASHQSAKYEEGVIVHGSDPSFANKLIDGRNQSPDGIPQKISKGVRTV